MSTIANILKQQLIGKSIRLKVQDQIIHQDSIVYVKKSKNVTDQQFESRNPRFRMISRRHVGIGRHRVFETHVITDVHIHGDEWDGYDMRVEVEGGKTYPIYMCEDLEIS